MLTDHCCPSRPNRAVVGRCPVLLALLLSIGASTGAAPFFLCYEQTGGENITVQSGQLSWVVAPHSLPRRAPLPRKETEALEGWVTRHRIFALASDYPSTNAAVSSTTCSLSLRTGEREHIVTWTTSSDCPQVLAAVKELRELAEAALGSGEGKARATRSPDATASALAEVLKPSKKLPFKSVIHATTQRALLDFDSQRPDHARLKELLSRAAALAGTRAFTKGIFTARANEAGNHIEPFVKAALREVGLRADTPSTTAGTLQTTGYPDIEINSTPLCYLELKTYNATTANTTQRTFYYSPSTQPKVTHDALHLLLAYQLEKTTRNGKPAFVPVHWKLLTLQDLTVDLKFEFNQSNRGLYGSDAARAVLAEGAVEGAGSGKEK